MEVIMTERTYAPVIYMRDVEGTGMMYPALNGDPEALVYVPAETAEEVDDTELWPTGQANGNAPVVFMRDIDGTGSLHPALKGDPGALVYVPADFAEEVGDAELWPTYQDVQIDFASL